MNGKIGKTSQGVLQKIHRREDIKLRLKDKILELMKSEGYRPMTEGEILVALDLDIKETDLLLKTLQSMGKKGLVVKNRKGKYGLPERMNLVVEHLEGNFKGYAFLIPDNPEMEGI